MNKCEETGLKHAWRETEEMWGFRFQKKQTCANCGLTRTKWSTYREGWSYSDGRPDEDTTPINPV